MNCEGGGRLEKQGNFFVLILCYMFWQMVGVVQNFNIKNKQETLPHQGRVYKGPNLCVMTL